MKAGVAIDKYKLDTFKKHLDKAGFKYTVHDGITPNTLLLQVECEFASDLQPIIQAANDAAKKGRGK